MTTMSGTRVTTIRAPLIAPRSRPSSSTPITTATRELLGLVLHQGGGDDARQGHHRADREVDPARDDDDGLGHRGERERQDRDRQALDAGRAVGRLDELGEHQQDRRGQTSSADRPRVAATAPRRRRRRHGPPRSRRGVTVGAPAGRCDASVSAGAVGADPRRLGDRFGRDLLGHERVRLQVVGRPQERRLVSVGGVELADDPSSEDDDARSQTSWISLSSDV